MRLTLRPNLRSYDLIRRLGLEVGLPDPDWVISGPVIEAAPPTPATPVVSGPVITG